MTLKDLKKMKKQIVVQLREEIKQELYSNLKRELCDLIETKFKKLEGE